MPTLLRLLTVAYVAACLVALWLIPASANGWLGVAREPLAGVFAILLALPWSLLMRLMGDPGPWTAAAVLAACMALNAWLLWRFEQWWRPRRAGAAGP